MNQAWREFAHWAVQSEGSTRACALMRMGFALNLWMRFADWLLFFRALRGQRAVFSIVFFCATTCMFFGIKARWSAAISAICAVLLYGYHGHYLGHRPWISHHIYLLAIGTLFVALTPCDRSLSFDRWLAVRRARQRGAQPPKEWGNLFATRLMVLQMSAMYFWTAYDKSKPAFLSGDRLEAILMQFYLWEYPQAAWFRPLMMTVATITVVTEYSLALLLPFRRPRRWLILPGLLLHGLFYVLLPIATFTLTVWTFYLAYLDPAAVHRFIDELTAGPAGQPENS